MAEYYNKSNEKNTNQNNKNNKVHFYSLTPRASDNYDKYEDAFNFGLNNSNEESKKITNIAITGPYASGKSSVIEKVKNKFGNDKFITLSLTNFNSSDIKQNNKTEKSNINNKKEEYDLEAQLINQLIHKIDSKKIRDSRFLSNKKLNTSKFSYKLETFIHALIISIITLCIIISFNNDTISKSILSKIEDIKNISINILLVIGSLYFFYLIYQFISLFKKKKILRKINIYGNEIELFSNEDDSIFDKYTDEILYLFRNAGVNFFIFEDIDRYEDVTIFKKLREINILLNDKLQRESKAPIKFIYLICDNMFMAEERTKFFDFIIPVVPYIHKGNAYDYMATLFADEIKEEKNKKFLIKLSLFIDNSRLLKNIANEYRIYNKFIHLKDTPPNTTFTKLLALIIYKNLFPKDFNQLYFNKGYLSELFNKEEFAKKQQLHLDDVKQKTLKECIIYKDNNIFFKSPKGYNYIYNGGYFDLIKFLIINGYIDETYKDYMSEIIETSLTYEERVFLQNIAIHNGEQYLLPLNRIYDKKYLDNLITFIDEKDYERKEILNIYLLENLTHFNNNKYNKIYNNLVNIYTDYIFINYYYQYLNSLYDLSIENNIKNDNPLYSFIKFIIINYNNLIKNPSLENGEKQYSFTSVIINIVESYKNHKLHINNELQKYIENILKDICDNNMYLQSLEDNINQDILFCYQNIFSYCNTNKPISYNIDIPQPNYFNFSKDLLNMEKYNTNHILDVLLEVGICFNNISNIESYKLLSMILDKQLFSINYLNILSIIRYCNQNIDIKFIENIFDELLQLKNKELQKYIFDNFDKLIETYNNEPLYYQNIESETYNKILESKLISDDHKEIFKRKFKPYK